ncbi:transglutaminase TgpA family protein [Mucisphaera sp.]|uniref:transglutaminase TgpA family protein n=1 Tax=Mucisphaera sp. TaxID=2913024 RepID=UPI003D139EA4
MLRNGRRLLFAQVMIGAIALCLALENPFLLMVVAGVGVLGWWWFERVMQQRLPGWVVSAGGVLALAGLLVEHLVLGHRMVVAMSHFTLMLQGLLLFGHKRPREIIALLAVSLIQMIVACVVSISMLFGVLMILYCLLLTWTLSRLQLETAYAGLGTSPRVPRRSGVRLLGAPLALRLVRGVIVSLCLVVGLVSFVLVPRSDRGTVLQDLTAPLGESATGYSERVDVKSSPEFEGSQQAVLRLRVTAHGAPFRGAGQVFMMRGMVFDQYDEGSGQWLRGVDAQARYQTVRLEMGRAQLAVLGEPMSLIDADVTLRQKTGEGLFTVLPVVSISSPNMDRVEFNPLDQVVRTTTAGGTGGAMRYRFTWPFFRSLDMPGAYFDRFDERRSPTTTLFTDREGDRYARGWPVDTAAIRRYAQEILGERGYFRDPEALFDPYDWDMATALAQRLRDTYRYLRYNPVPKDGTDPVSAFLLDHQTGHCELFASGLAALCRSVGIQARLVVGYRVSEFNEAGDYFVAREKHAHAWVEVATEQGGGWRSLDATPHSSIEALHREDEGWVHAMRSWYERLEFAWIGSVVSYDYQARDLLVSWAQNLPVAAGDIAAFFGRLWARVSGWFSMLTGSSLALWAGLGAGAMGLGTAGLAVWLLARRREMERLGLEDWGWGEGRRWRRELGFYLSMVRLLERQGFVRPAWQTPRAFAEELSEANPMRFGPVVSLTAAFYEVRFGGVVLDEARRARVRAHLSALARGMASGGSRL